MTATVDTEAPAASIAVRLRGVDHLALVTDDMVKTVAFYTEVLAFPLVHARRVPLAADRGQPPYDNLRHYFFDMGNDTLLAFFEYPPEAPRGNRDSLGSMQHLAFHADRDNFQAMIRRLKHFGVDYAGPVYLGDRFTSIYFYDPNGIRLEVTTDIDHDHYVTVNTVYQTESTARTELETLYSSDELEKVLVAMPRPTHTSRRREEP